MNIPPPSGPRHYGRLKYSFNSYDHWSSKNYWIPKPDDSITDIWIPIPGMTSNWTPISEFQ